MLRKVDLQVEGSDWPKVRRAPCAGIQIDYKRP